MRKISENLQKKEVINVEIVRDIRNWINQHYAHESERQKSKIFAQKIHQKLDRELPNFSKELKTTVRMDLIKNHIKKNSLTINADHIVHSSVKFANNDELQREICHWLKDVHHQDAQFIEKYVARLYHEIHSKEIAATQAIETKQKEDFVGKLKYESKMPYVFGSIAAILLIFTLLVVKEDLFSLKNAHIEDVEIKSESVTRIENELPPYLQYEPIDEEQLQSFLSNRNSLLVEEPYFSTIINVAEQFNIHPFLMFAITGQEQGFVPKTDKDAHLMANNPFNVYYSWQEFNTNILESSEIAARTIVNLSEDRPQDVDPIQWINRKYAEDQSWWIGVSAIFNEIVAYVE